MYYLKKLQPHQGGLVGAGNSGVQGQGGNGAGSGNRRVGGGQNAQSFEPNQPGYNQQSIQNLPPAQQQALIAAQLTYAMAAAAQGNLNMPGQMYGDNGQSPVGPKGIKDERGNNNNNNMNPNIRDRQFARRGGNNSRGGRDDSYPFDSKRARY